jgi:hypothetical protein
VRATQAPVAHGHHAIYFSGGARSGPSFFEVTQASSEGLRWSELRKEARMCAALFACDSIDSRKRWTQSPSELPANPPGRSQPNSNPGSHLPFGLRPARGRAGRTRRREPGEPDGAWGLRALLGGRPPRTCCEIFVPQCRSRRKSNVLEDARAGGKPRTVPDGPHRQYDQTAAGNQKLDCCVRSERPQPAGESDYPFARRRDHRLYSIAVPN